MINPALEQICASEEHAELMQAKATHLSRDSERAT